MISEIIRKYETFSDALITKFTYSTSTEHVGSKGDIEMFIKCMNSENDYNWEVIKLMFIEVVEFRIVENENTSSTVVNTALLKTDDERIIVDFFPLIYAESDLKENPKSDLIIKCKNLKYEVVEGQ